MPQPFFRSNNNYLLTTVAGEHVVVPIVNSIAKLANVISINEIGLAVFQGMEHGLSPDDIAAKLNDNYEFPDGFDLDAHVRQFVGRMLQHGFFTQTDDDAAH